ncbi:ribosomal protein S18-alanine N-acetyltransferase [Rhodobacterales bacterium HKCCE2091]|nr:ribosomal protein S18-alanine N-acetyltransferase [Rhodobacterales bacterium HKCCE2091]
MAAIHAAAFSRQRPWSASEFAALLSDRTTRSATVPHGFGLIRLLPPEAEILTLAVHPDGQRRGAGRRILDNLMEMAAGAGAERMFLEVAASNAAARALYAAAGFVETGTRPRYYRYPDGTAEDAVLMETRLRTGAAPPLPKS